MKRTYFSPATQVAEVNIKSNILQGSGSTTVDPNQEVNSNFSREKQGGFGKGIWED